MAVVSAWILFFYTTFCGLSAVQAASIFAIARILDAIASPLIGHLSDSIGSTALAQRFGRRRVFLLFAIPLLPSFAFMWLSGQSYLYYLCTYVFFELVYASVIIPYETLAAEMTDDYRKRAKFAGARILVGQVSAIAAGILPSRIVEVVGGKGSAETFLIMGGIFAAAFMIVVLTVYLFTWERDPSEWKTQQPIINNNKPMNFGHALFQSLRRLYSNLSSTLRIRAFRLHLGMYLGGYISQDIFNAAFTYFVVFALSGTVVIASNMLATVAIAQLIAVAVFIPLVIKIHPAPAYRLAVVFYALGIIALLFLYFIPQQSKLLWLYLPVIICGLGRGALNYIPWNTYNYMADVDQIVTAQRREGIFAGVMTFVRKATQAIAIMLVGFALDAGGFVSGAQSQNDSAITTIVLVLALAPLLVLSAGFWVSTKFTINSVTHKVLMDEINRFKTGDTQEPTPENRSTVEQLSGWPYEKLWGKNDVVLK
ncbi:MAG: MFS transporter [Spongiibacteraceae bacterium]|nr:MFS transporter [Spongiibacteraceae bacterium]